MLTNSPAQTTLPAANLDRARAFYEEKLGLKPIDQNAGGLTYESGGTRFLVFISSGTATGQHTQMSWEVDDVAAVVADLKGRGVTFEEYDQPGLKTVDGIAEMPPGKGGWFKDSEGNLLAVFQRV